MKKHRQLTFEDRVYIEVWHWERKSLNYMARIHRLKYLGKKKGVG